MKVSLIYPLLSKARSRVDENKQYWPPLGLAYIAAVLRENGHAVQILDRDLILRKNKLDFDKTDKLTLNFIKAFAAEIVGFSATTPNVSDVNAFSEKVKKSSPEIMTVIGGPHCAGEPVATLRMCSCIDALVRGEGEMAMLDLANSVPLESIGSLTYRKSDGSVVSNLDRPLIESLDSVPFPARDLLDMGYYTRPSRFISRNFSLRTTHIFTARGCPYNCHYCAGPLIGRRMVRYHSPQRVVAEIEELIDKYSIEAVYFAEDMFLSNRNRVQEMTALFKQHDIHKKISWMAQISTNIVSRELLAMMKDAGCVHVEYGFESGSQRILDLMNKRTSLERNKEVAILTRKSGLHFQGNFIVGYPGEREEDFKKTVSFIKEARPSNVSLNIFMPLPGTEIYKKLKDEGRLLPNWDDLGNPETPQINYADMPPTHFEKLYFNTKLKVILPINLLQFIKDNVRHPFRLFYVAATQFKSVITRAIKAVTELRRIKGMRVKDANVLFIAYHSASYPIMESQGFAYMSGLVEEGVKYSILTFEKKNTILESCQRISELGAPVKWRYLLYHSKPRFLATSRDILCGMFSVLSMVRKGKIGVIHARGFIPALIGFLPARFCRVKLFFDTRGLLADKYVGGGLLSPRSATYRLMRFGEDYLLKKSDYFTVETNKHAQIIRSSKNGVSDKMEVIPCCVNIKKFHRPLKSNNFNSNHKKVGTWYLIGEMLDFFKVASERIPNACFTFLTHDEPESIYSIAKDKGVDASRIAVKALKMQEIPDSLNEGQAGIFFINPYKRYNSSPIKFGEYLASGMPVIVNSGIGDCDEVILKEKTGVVINDFSLQEYERAATELSSLMSEGHILRERCVRAAERHFSLDMGIKKYRDIYGRLLGEK
ncbi:MAG: Radical SAM domain protein [Parcubacteria group bacterium GW2011_GWC2_38_7]|nr:MAG: Radical SAM domain protein [Parcubacteria group bacterium GW2011_GWC2_38_7]